MSSNALDPESRKPDGLPFSEIDLGIPASLMDLQGQRVSWPPTRLKDRQERFQAQHEGSLGLYDRWLDTSVFDVQLNPIAGFEDDVLALLLATPIEGLAPDIEAQARLVIAQMTRDLLRHGKTTVMLSQAGLLSLPIRYGWPLTEGGWLWVIPEVSTRAQQNRADTVRLLIWRNDVLTGVVRQWDASQMGAVIEALPAVPATLSTADRAPMSNSNWGTPISDRLIHLSVLMARRESGIDWAIDRNERPILQFRHDVQPQTITRSLVDALSGQQADALALRTAAPALRESDVLLVPPGMDAGEMLTWDQNIDGADRFLMRLDAHFTEQTGFAPVEAADSADTSSGVAVARRNARGVARVAQLHHAISTALEEVGLIFTWEYIGNIMGDMVTPEEPVDEIEMDAF